MTTTARLAGLLQPGEEQPWHEHDGSGRPHPPKSFVQIETRDGAKLALCSAFIRWPWVTPDELEGYADDPDPASDVMRWRFAKEPPSKIVLAAAVPELLARIAVLESTLEQTCDALENVLSGDPEMPTYQADYDAADRQLDLARATLNRSENDAG